MHDRIRHVNWESCIYLTNELFPYIWNLIILNSAASLSPVAYSLVKLQIMTTLEIDTHPVRSCCSSFIKTIPYPNEIVQIMPYMP